MRGHSPLTRAVLHDSTDVIEKLLRAGASVDFPNNHGRTPLMEAASLGNTAICRLLLHHGANIHETDQSVQEYTALHYAAVCGPSGCGRYETAALLVTYGAEIYDPTKPLEGSPIAGAISMNNHRVVDIFLDHCNKSGHKIPWGSLFNMTLECLHEECIVSVLHHGYYPREVAWASQTSCFYKTAQSGLMKAMSLLLELNPYYLQEEWLLHHYFPRKLKQHHEFVTWLVKYRKQPASLAKLSKSSIVAQLGSSYVPKINALQKQFIAWLVGYRKQPVSLAMLCKSMILVQLGSPYVPKINALPLPKALKMFLEDSIWRHLAPLYDRN